MEKNASQHFMNLIQENAAIIHKVIHLYVDNEEDRKDLFQEIIYQSWKSYARFAGHSKFSTWLYKVSLNTVMTFKRRKDKSKEVQLPEKLDIKAEQKETNDQSTTLLLAIRQLDEIDRMIITLHLDAYSNEEIAHISGMTKNHIAVKLHRIKAQLIEQVRNLSTIKK